MSQGAAAHAARRAELHPIADLYTTLLALYIADKRVRDQMHQLLRDRADVRS